MKLELHWKIIIGLVLGLMFGVVAATQGLEVFVIKWVSPFGDIFLNLLKLIAVPLVLSSLITGVASLSDTKKLSRIGGKTITIYITTTAIAVTIGLISVNILQPGNTVPSEMKENLKKTYKAEGSAQEVQEAEINRDSFRLEKLNKEIQNLKSFLDRVDIVNLDEKNAWQSNLQIKLTEKKTLDTQIAEKLKVLNKLKEASKVEDRGPLQPLVEMVPENVFTSASSNKNMLQIVFIAIIFGIALIQIPKNKGRPVLDFFEGINELVIKLVDNIMLLAPIGVFALIASTITSLAGDNINSILQLLGALGYYMLAVIIGLILQMVITYTAVLKLFSKMDLKKFYKGIAPAQLLAFSTSSSAATLPVTMERCEDELGVSEEVSSFVLPLGATINMDGTALYQAVAAVFISQIVDMNLTLVDQLAIIFTAVLASIGTAAVPGAGIIMLVIILQAIGAPSGGIGLILGVDRILDMMRTITNVTGDASVAVAVASSEGELKNS